MEEKKLTPQQRLEISHRIMEAARKRPEFRKRVEEVVFKAGRRVLMNEN